VKHYVCVGGCARFICVLIAARVLLRLLHVCPHAAAAAAREREREREYVRPHAGAAAAARERARARETETVTHNPPTPHTAADDVSQ
jgi:hypothetical protein